MEFGLFTEFHSPPGVTEAAAFDESLAQMKAAEDFGFDAVWLAEIHFQKDRSVLSAPLIVASALAACTQRVKIGIAVQVLPLSHPLRLAEDVATVDHIRAKRPARPLPGLQYSLQREPRPLPRDARHPPQGMDPGPVLTPGEILQFQDVCIMPKPYQKPHPPIRIAAAAAREVRANRLAEISYDEVLGEYAVFGTPEAVADRLLALREEMGFSTLSTWMNPGGQIPNERVLKSMRLFAERVAPRLA